MEQNKTGKYLKYAIGEIVLVMVGILLALQVNNWNENRVRKVDLHLYLNNLAKTIAVDTLVMNTLENVNMFRYYSLQYVLEQSGKTKYDPKKDGFDPPPFIGFSVWEKPIPKAFDSTFIHFAFLWSHRKVNQNLNTSALDELKSTGMFSQIKNNMLKESINEYYKHGEGRLGQTNQANHNALIKNWEASLGEDGLLTSEVGSLDDPLALIRNNDKRAYLLKTLVREAVWSIRNAVGINTRAKTLIEQINNYINTDQ